MVKAEGKKVTALIIADSGFMRDGLLTLLATLPDVKVVGAANGELLGTELSIELHPQMVLVDCTLSNGKAMEFLRNVKINKIPTRCLAIVESYDDCKKAASMGADGVLVKGFSNSDLVRVLNRMMSKPIRTGPIRLNAGE